ncbi:MAG: restriction endonuclease [candidate division WOR-3 bacterium]
MFKDERIWKLLEELIEKRKDELKPKFDPTCENLYRYPEAEEVLGKPPLTTVYLIEDLARLGYLKKIFKGKLFLCPVCNSDELKYETYCPKCHSTYILKMKAIEHICGYLGKLETYQDGKNLRCPKCLQELQIIDEDYKFYHAYYQCQDCEEYFKEPKEFWRCLKCGATIEKENLKEIYLFSYQIKEEEISGLKLKTLPKDQIINFLKNQGYEVEEGVKVNGRSGAEHEIDILATKKSGPLEHRIVVGFATAEEEVPAEEVIKLYAKAYDVNAADIILVALPKLSADALHFAKHYRIRVFEKEDLERLEKAFLEK